MGEAPALRIHVFSFSYRNSGPPVDDSGHGGGFVFDCRALPNPYWEESLRPHTGREPVIAEFMERHPEVAEFAERATGLVLYAARTYRERGYERLMAAFGCTGGRHRSVYLAELLGRRLEQEGYSVVLEHRDIGLEPERQEP